METPRHINIDGMMGLLVSGDLIEGVLDPLQKNLFCAGPALRF